MATAAAATSPGPSSGAEPNTEFTQSGAVPLVEGLGQGGTNIEVDDSTDGDSSFGTELSSATTSVTSSVFSFTYANGRRYHSDRFQRASYFMPNDEAEQDRLDMYHHIFLSLLGGKLYTAPLENPHRVLDVGTGTGIWAIDFADENPQSEVIGTDISPIQPSWVPPNVKFEVEDMEEEWTYPKNHFDYIHLRSLSGCFSDWDSTLRQSYDALAPGGYVEYQDYGCQIYNYDGTFIEGINDKHPPSTYFHYLTKAAERQGRPLLIAPTMADRMEKNGFVDVTVHRAIWPLGPWPKDKRLKELGKWGRIGASESAYPFGVHLLTKEGWTIDKVKELCDATSAALFNNKYYTYGYFVYGRKPTHKKSTK